MTETLTRHENPQCLARIMREAWSIKRITKCAFGDALRAAWALARQRAGKLKPERPRNLTQYLHWLGGLKPCGELRQIAAPLVILRRNGFDLEYAARLATDDGFDIRECPNRLLDFIRDETFGERHYAQFDAGAALDAEAWEAANDIPF